MVYGEIGRFPFENIIKLRMATKIGVISESNSFNCFNRDGQVSYFSV
jgi:hypothetical protein